MFEIFVVNVCLMMRKVSHQDFANQFRMSHVGELVDSSFVGLGGVVVNFVNFIDIFLIYLKSISSFFI